MRNYKTRGYFDRLADMVQLMDYFGNVNRAISVVGYWIFDSNYEKTLVLNGHHWT